MIPTIEHRFDRWRDGDGAHSELAQDLSAYTLIDGRTLSRDWYGDRLTRCGLDVIVDTYVRNRAKDETGDPWALAA